MRAINVSYNDTWVTPPLGASDVQHAIDALKIYPNYVELIKTITGDNSIGSPGDMYNFINTPPYTLGNLQDVNRINLIKKCNV